MKNNGARFLGQTYGPIRTAAVYNDDLDNVVAAMPPNVANGSIDEARFIQCRNDNG
jgi:hypothetical protein